MVRYLFYTIRDLTYQSPLVFMACYRANFTFTSKKVRIKQNERSVFVMFVPFFVTGYTSEI